MASSVGYVMSESEVIRLAGCTVESPRLYENKMRQFKNAAISMPNYRPTLNLKFTGSKTVS